MASTFTDRQAGLMARRLVLAIAASSLLTVVAAAQGANGKATIDAIVGSEVQEEQAKTAADADKVIAAIDATGAAIEFARKVSKLGKVEIVFLIDATPEEGGLPPEIQAKVDQNKPQIVELRKELEGNAMLFHAIDSRHVLIQDVIAVAFDGEVSATIYATAKPAG